MTRPSDYTYIGRDGKAVLARELEDRIEASQAWIKDCTAKISNAIGGGSELFTRHGDEYRLDVDFVCKRIREMRERQHEAMHRAIRAEREAKSAASTIAALEARVKELEGELERVKAESSKEEDEAYEIGKRDGYSDAVQDIDQLTGGDGEYRYCLGMEDSPRHVPTPAAMIEKIKDRFETLNILEDISEVKEFCARAEAAEKRVKELEAELAATYEELVEHVGDGMDDAYANRIAALKGGQ